MEKGSNASWAEWVKAVALIMTIVLTVFGAAWTFSRDTNARIAALDDKIDREIRGVSERLVRVETLLEELLNRRDDKTN